jgi:hypothetical protein
MDAQGKPADRSPGSPAHALLENIADTVQTQGVSVVATGRIAAHLLGAPRLETVGQLRQRLNLWEAEAGPERKVIELFDWVVIDRRELLYQSEADAQFAAELAVDAGYLLLVDQYDILVLVRPGTEPR